MRILVLSDLPPEVLGGAEVQTRRLVRQWLNSGHAVETAGHRSEASIRDLDGHELRVHCLPVIRRFGTTIRAVSYFLSLTFLLLRRQNHYDLIYCRFLSEAALSIVALKGLGLMTLPLVSTPAAAGAGGDAALIRSLPFTGSLVRLVNRHCNAINVIAKAIGDELDLLGINVGRISAIPNGVDCPVIKARSMVAQPRRLLFTGRLTHQKGIDILFHALHGISERKNDYRLVLAGNGDEKDTLKTLAYELDLDIEFLGECDHDSIWSLLVESDVFLLPSRYEGLSNAVLEAMAAGLPIVVTRCQGIDDYIDPETGWVCAADDIEALTDSLVKMLDTPPQTLLAMGSRSRQIIDDKFSIQEVAQKYIQLFEDVLQDAVVS
ncbi:MAG: glycosyltransferase family 4 protein [Gammaproteobacteria bacterium]|nr:glycosyltransferase family 4 protein [Gammaproteobacteria bacterium]